MSVDFATTEAMIGDQISVRSSVDKPSVIIMHPGALASELPVEDAIVCFPADPSNIAARAKRLTELVRNSAGRFQGALILPRGTHARDCAEHLPGVAAQGIGWFVSPDDTITQATLDELRAKLIDPSGDPAWLQESAPDVTDVERHLVQEILARGESELPDDHHLDEYFR